MTRDEQIIREAPNRFVTREYLALVLGSDSEVTAFIRRCLGRGLLTASRGGWVRAVRV